MSTTLSKVASVTATTTPPAGADAPSETGAGRGALARRTSAERSTAPRRLGPGGTLLTRSSLTSRRFGRGDQPLREAQQLNLLARLGDRGHVEQQLQPIGGDDALVALGLAQESRHLSD